MMFDTITTSSEPDPDRKSLTDISVIGSPYVGGSATGYVPRKGYSYGSVPRGSMWDSDTRPSPDSKPVGSGAEYAYNHYIKKGYSPKVAAGIAGNLHQESGVNPHAVGDGGTSFGVAQWHNDRVEGLKKYAKSKGKHWTDLDTQLDYAAEERPGIIKKMESAKDHRDSTMIYTNEFERPNPKYAEYGNRVGAADKLIRKKPKMRYGGPIPRKDIGGDPPVKKTSGFNTSSDLNKAVNEGVGFTRSWAAQRADSGFMGLTPEDAYGIAKPKLMTQQELEDKQNQGKPSGFSGRLGGFYRKSEDQSFVSSEVSPALAKTISTHESTHDWQHTIDDNHIDGFGVDPIRKSYANIKKEQERSALGSINQYLLKPNEVHARIMELRAGLKLTPDVKVTQEHIEQIKREQPKLYKDLSTSLDDQGIINSFNKTVSNDRPTDTSIATSRYGGSVKKYRYGGPIPRKALGGVDESMSKPPKRNRYLSDLPTASLSNVGSATEPAVEPTLAEKKPEIRAANQGYKFTRNWYQQRVNDDYQGMGDSQDVVDGIAKPEVYKTEQGFKTATGQTGVGGVFVENNFIPSMGTSAVLTTAAKESYPNDYYGGISSMASHETNHDAQSEMGASRLSLFKIVNPALPAWQNSEDRINTELKRSDKPSLGANDAYYRSPLEVHSRVMQLRQENGLVPGQVVRKRDLRKMRNSPAYKQLQQVLDDEGIRNSLNHTVMNEQPIDTSIATGRYGGSVRKLRFGGPLKKKGDGGPGYSNGSSYRDSQFEQGVYTSNRKVKRDATQIVKPSIAGTDFDKKRTNERLINQYNTETSPVNIPGAAAELGNMTLRDTMNGTRGMTDQNIMAEPDIPYGSNLPAPMTVRLGNYLDRTTPDKMGTDHHQIPTRPEKDRPNIKKDLLNDRGLYDSEAPVYIPEKKKRSPMMRFGGLAKAGFGKDQYSSIGTGLEFLGETANSFDKSTKYADATLSTVGGALKGAGTGAGIGTAILPGIGTAVGAGVGAIAGAIGGSAKAAKEKKIYDDRIKTDSDVFNQFMKARSSQVLQNYPTFGQRVGSYRYGGSR